MGIGVRGALSCRVELHVVHASQTDVGVLTLASWHRWHAAAAPVLRAWPLWLGRGGGGPHGRAPSPSHHCDT